MGFRVGRILVYFILGKEGESFGRKSCRAFTWCLFLIGVESRLRNRWLSVF